MPCGRDDHRLLGGALEVARRPGPWPAGSGRWPSRPAAGPGRRPPASGSSPGARSSWRAPGERPSATSRSDPRAAAASPLPVAAPGRRDTPGPSGRPRPLPAGRWRPSGSAPGGHRGTGRSAPEAGPALPPRRSGAPGAPAENGGGGGGTCARAPGGATSNSMRHPSNACRAASFVVMLLPRSSRCRCALPRAIGRSPDPPPVDVAEALVAPPRSRGRHARGPQRRPRLPGAAGGAPGPAGGHRAFQRAACNRSRIQETRRERKNTSGVRPSTCWLSRGPAGGGLAAGPLAGAAPSRNPGRWSRFGY